jgi:hypothetical protein
VKQETQLFGRLEDEDFIGKAETEPYKYNTPIMAHGRVSWGVLGNSPICGGERRLRKLRCSGRKVIKRSEDNVVSTRVR